MSLYRPPSVEDIPELVLTSWRVFEVASDKWTETTRHFVGYNETERSGRVSSAIQKFNKKKKIGITRSGRAYQIKGKPGNDMDALYVWSRWCELNKVTTIKDVTEEYLEFKTGKP